MLEVETIGQRGRMATGSGQNWRKAYRFATIWAILCLIFLRCYCHCRNATITQRSVDNKHPVSINKLQNAYRRQLDA